MPSILRDAEAVRTAVQQSGSIKEALSLLGLRAAGGNYRSFREACIRFGLDVPDADLRIPDGRRFLQVVPDSEVFCENSRYLHREAIKRRLSRRGVPERCALCDLGPEWNGLRLVLQLDHINGVFNDNRFDNLRLLCPNCHSQTATYAGRSEVRRSRIVPDATWPPCPHCERRNRIAAKRCGGCHRWFVKPAGHLKIEWPEDGALLRMAQQQSLVAVGRALGVSDTAVRNRLDKAGLLATLRA